MKKLFWIISTLVYLFSINSLVHANIMWFFDTHTNNIHCWSSNSDTTQNDNKEHCFVSVTSNDFSPIINQEIKSWIFQNPITDIVSYKYNFQIFDKSFFVIHKVVDPPGKLYQKYLTFSDLFGVIVKLS